MSPSINARWSEVESSLDFVAFRAVLTTLYPRARNARTIPAPMPCDAPVTITVLGELFISSNAAAPAFATAWFLIAAPPLTPDCTYYFVVALQRDAASENHDLAIGLTHECRRTGLLTVNACQIYGFNIETRATCKPSS